MTDTRLLVWGTIDKKDKTQLIIDDCREIDNLKLLIINLESSQASDVRVQNTLRDCLVKFKPDKAQCGIKVPVLAAVRNKNGITYVKFGAQLHRRYIRSSKSLEDNHQVNLKSLVTRLSFFLKILSCGFKAAARCMFIGIFSIPKDPGSLSQLADNIPKLILQDPTRKTMLKLQLLKKGDLRYF